MALLKDIFNTFKRINKITIIIFTVGTIITLLFVATSLLLFYLPSVSLSFYTNFRYEAMDGAPAIFMLTSIAAFICEAVFIDRDKYN